MLGRLLSLMLIASLLPLATAPPQEARAGGQAVCDRWASVDGDDGSAGTRTSPLRTLRALVERLQPGETGCLEDGETFGSDPDLPYGDLTIIGEGGTREEPIVIRSEPGGRAAYRGQIWIKGSAHDLIFHRIDFLGTKNIPKGTHLIVDGDRIIFRRNDITSPEGICIDVGDIDAYDDERAPVRSNRFRLVRNRIHDCGSTASVTSADSGVHGVYLVNTKEASIVDNFIFDNRNRGLQLWPNADATTVRHNTFDANGSNVNIGSCWQPFCSRSRFSEDNLIADNVITFSKLLSNTEQDVPPGDTHQVLGNFPNDGRSRGNAVKRNCLYHPDETKNFGGYGYSRNGNRVRRPRYVDRATDDLRLTPSSPCAGKGVRTAS